MAPRAKAADAAQDAQPAIVAEALELAMPAQLLPNHNPALRVVSVPDVGDTAGVQYFPILAWRQADDGSLEAVTPCGTMPLPIVEHGSALLLYDQEQRKALLDRKWVKPEDLGKHISPNEAEQDANSAESATASEPVTEEPAGAE
ncbi:hypothetical protein [Parahaliea mediterranea]|uniref:hypothetical protein n=1 Tax=Parahaliea mediterranea TaxID=651086 RepID=UPI000E2FBC1F|nr:hypothetical protein [Parahaliea mediterranea]